jgi:hypothetical protein
MKIGKYKTEAGWNAEVLVIKKNGYSVGLVENGGNFYACFWLPERGIACGTSPSGFNILLETYTPFEQETCRTGK